MLYSTLTIFYTPYALFWFENFILCQFFMMVNTKVVYIAKTRRVYSKHTLRRFERLAFGKIDGKGWRRRGNPSRAIKLFCKDYDLFFEYEFFTTLCTLFIEHIGYFWADYKKGKVNYRYFALQLHRAFRNRDVIIEID